MAEATTLRSGIIRSYGGRFVVDEDSLRRLQAALAKGAPSLGFDTHVVFHVDREDDRFYETTDLSDVLSDANLPGRRVQSLSIELRRVGASSTDRPWQERWVVQVTFGTASGLNSRSRYRRMFDETAELTVMTPDRNWALLMADELEPQVQRVLAKSRMSWLTYPAAVAMLLVIGAVSEVLRVQAVSVLLQPYTIWKMTAAFPLGVVLAWMLRSLPFRILLPLGFERWFGHESVFLWGEELKQYPQRQRFRRNLLWSVVVAFLVSLLASLLAWVLTAQGPKP
jgi:hypothetical protein